MSKKPPHSILMVMNGPPWSEWTMSGVSKGVCEALLAKGVLYGAVSHHCKSQRHFDQPAGFYKLEEYLQQVKDYFFSPSAEQWQSESSPALSAIIDAAPSSTALIYTYVNPEYSADKQLRRFRWIGISILDAVKHQSYGYRELDKNELKHRYQQQYETIHRSQAIFTHSSYGADSIARDFSYPREKIFPIGAGASIQFPEMKDTSIERYARANILFIGRDWERKGGPLVHQAFLLLKKKIPHATLTIVGPTVQPVFGDGIIFKGFLRKNKFFERRKIKKLYLEASLFCTPSVCETWGLVYVEAAASGLPIVGTDEWAMPDIVVSGKTGLLIHERTPDALSNAMYQVLSDPHSAKTMGEAAITHVDSVLDWPHVADRIIAVACPEALKGRTPVWLPKDIDRSLHTLSQTPSPVSQQSV